MDVGVCVCADLELNGKFRFSVHVKTGYVMSDRTLKEADKAVSEILGMEFVSEDWLPLNGSPEVVKILRDKMIALRTRSRSKKSKKRQPAAPQDPAANNNTPKKKQRTVEAFAPEDASKRIYASIFSQDDGREGETFLCRSVAARGMNLT